MNNVFLFLAFFLVFIPSFFVYAVETGESASKDTIGELLLFYDEAELFIASRHETPVHEAPAIASVISDREIRNMGARNLFDILEKVPGIGVSIGSIPVLSSVEIRGIKTLWSEKILVMIDGHRVNGFLNGSGVIHFGDMSVDFIKRVEIIRGPGSALYGADAFLGVINVVTKQPEDIDGVQVTAGGGSFDTQHANLMFGHSGKDSGVSGFFDYLDTDGPSSFIEQDAIGNSGNTLDWREKKELGFNIFWKDFTLRGRYQKNDNGPYIGTASVLNDETVMRFGNVGFLDLAYSKPITKKLDIQTRLYADFMKIDNYFEIFPEGFPGYPEGALGNPKSKQRIVGVETMVDYRLAAHLLTTGFMYENDRLYDVKHSTNFDPLTFIPLGSYQDISSWGNFNEDHTRDIWALYLQDIWDINPAVSLTCGVRYDHYSDFGGTVNPRAGFVWEFMDDTSVKLLYGSAFRAPSFTELYQKNNPSNVGNANLAPEEIDTYEVGLERRLGKDFTLRLDYFYSKMKNLIIIGEKPSLTDPAENVNQGTAKVDGIEAEFAYDFGNDAYGYINYCYQHPTNGETGQRLPEVPNHKVNALVNYSPWKYLNANVGVSWIGKRPRDNNDTRQDLPAATLVDLTLIVRNFYKTLEFRGSAYNLFDEDYRDPSPYPVQVPHDYPTNERMFLIEARYTF